MASSSDNEQDAALLAAAPALHAAAKGAGLIAADPPYAMSELCTCTLSTVTLRYVRSADCPIHERPRVTFESIAWERIPEQTVCICGDVKGVHRRDPRAGTTRCGSGSAAAFRAIAQRLAATDKKTDAPLPAVKQGCRCPGFYDVDERLPWLAFTDRLLGEFDVGAPESVVTENTDKGVVCATIPARPNLQARARAALVWAWKASGLRTDSPARTWNQWLADSKRVWKAWREAGSPMRAFGKPAAFGPVSIPVLEDR